MSNNKFVGALDLNPIKLILKPSVTAKLGFKLGSLQWFLVRADKVKDKVELSGYGCLPNDSKLTEVQLDSLKLSDYPIVFNTFLKGLKKKTDLSSVKEICHFYFRVDYTNNECASQLFFINNEGLKKKTQNIISTF